MSKSGSPKSTDHHSSVETNKKALEFIEDVTTNVDEVQKRVLAEILSRNAEVEYLKRFGLNGHVDRETFKKIVPLITYEDIESDIKRIANGDKSPILCSHPITEFLTSSATSGGERKLLPYIEEEFKRKSFLLSLSMPVISQYMPGLEKGKMMLFHSLREETKTPGGILARPAITNYIKTSLLVKDRPFDPYANYTSPYENLLCSDPHQSMYSQILCGLLQNKQVLRTGAPFATGFIFSIRFLEKHWDVLCQDIRTGTLNAKITDPSLREAVMKILKSDPELADFIEAECKKKSWQGIIPRLWPNTKYIQVTVTGSMSQYIPTLDYYSNNLPLVSMMYASSECYFGLNLNPFCKPSEVSYTLIPTMAYFEFLPVHRNNSLSVDSNFMPESLGQKEQPKLVDLADVELGQEYEIVVTTYAGLYRYRVGDILRVTGFKNKAPQFSFVCRDNVVLSIDAEKTDEFELQNSVKNGAAHLMPFDKHLTDYTSYGDTSTIPGHYVLFWELNVNDSFHIPPSTFEDCCLTIEESLNSVYRMLRGSGTLGPLEIKIVENGTFDKLLDYAISLGGSVNQYKTPRCVKSAPIIELLNSRVVSTYFSSECPKSTPSHKDWSNINNN